MTIREIVTNVTHTGDVTICSGSGASSRSKKYSDVPKELGNMAALGFIVKSGKLVIDLDGEL